MLPLVCFACVCVCVCGTLPSPFPTQFCAEWFFVCLVQLTCVRLVAFFSLPLLLVPRRCGCLFRHSLPHPTTAPRTASFSSPAVVFSCTFYDFASSVYPPPSDAASFLVASLVSHLVPPLPLAPSPSSPRVAHYSLLYTTVRGCACGGAGDSERVDGLERHAHTSYLVRLLVSLSLPFPVPVQVPRLTGHFFFASLLYTREPVLPTRAQACAHHTSLPMGNGADVNLVPPFPSSACVCSWMYRYASPPRPGRPAYVSLCVFLPSPPSFGFRIFLLWLLDLCFSHRPLCVLFVLTSAHPVAPLRHCPPPFWGYHTVRDVSHLCAKCTCVGANLNVA
uniref:Uncharacterized protein n=1 Tax=Leishmania guyanensis TaxID=5670 RepID=A0A1E1IRX0_LEIGU|nr:Hypothetical protein BN36_1414870 [Leishmania guyanensis]